MEQSEVIIDSKNHENIIYVQFGILTVCKFYWGQLVVAWADWGEMELFLRRKVIDSFGYT